MPILFYLTVINFNTRNMNGIRILFAPVEFTLDNKIDITRNENLIKYLKNVKKN